MCENHGNFDLPWTTLEGRGTFPGVRAEARFGSIRGGRREIRREMRDEIRRSISRVTMTVIAMIAVIAAIAATAAEARADDSRERAEVVLTQAEAEDAALELARALSHYDEGRAIDPGSPRAPRAEARAAMLRAHSEGELVPFAKLERLRRDPALSSDPREVEKLVNEAEGFPPGLVRIEVWVLAAEAFAHRFGRPLDAEALLLRALADPLVDPVVAQKAARDATTLQLARGDFARAHRTVQLAGTRVDARLGADVRRAERRRTLHHAAIATLVVMALLAARATIMAVRRRRGGELGRGVKSTWRLVVAYAAYVSIAGAVLASGYETGTSKPFLSFGLVLVPILLLARVWGAAGGEGRGVRSARAALSGLAALGAAFLVLEGVDVGFLEGLGL